MGKVLIGLFRAALLATAVTGIMEAEAPQPSTDATSTGAERLSVSELSRRVLEYNFAVQEKLLDYVVTHRRFRSEYGLFEPGAFGSVSHEANRRQNSTQQAAAANGAFELKEVNTLYEAGVEALAPTGARIRAGYNLSDFRNNIPPSAFAGPLDISQFQSFAGLSVSQPLLKNFGSAATLAKIRMAALSSKIAFQEYRRELQTAVATAEATYWTLYLAQQQVTFFEDSVRVAEKILHDNRALLEAGKGSDLEVVQAQAGVGLRRAKLDDARQKVAEAMNRLISLYGETASSGNRRVVLTDGPTLDTASYDVADLFHRAQQSSPEYVIQKEKIQQELVRLGYARNQRRPEVNLKGAYGLNGLDTSTYSSLKNVTNASFPSWSFGVELRIPLLGDIRGRNELSAARLQVTAMEVALRGLETEIANGIDVARQRVEGARSSAGNFQSVVSYSQSLLDTAMVSLSAGKIESRKVFEIESDLFDAKNAVLEAMVNYKVAQVKLGLITGSILSERHLEVTQEQLQASTKQLARTNHWDEATFQKALQDVHAIYPAGKR